jgi:glycosyltransferase involved in cell wall biosynthesis
MNPQLSSLTIFFPFLNDAGTVEAAITQAFSVGNRVTKNLEVLAIHGGRSVDNTWSVLQKMQKRFPSLKVLDCTTNTDGYAVIRHGFAAATKSWVFYTDGDLQYAVEELPLLVRAQQTTHADVVNGYKHHRGDTLLRFTLGWMYALWARWLFHLPVRDVDCDFRLIRRSCLRRFQLESKNASILPELLYKLTRCGTLFTEVPVSHRKRVYGKSNYKAFGLLIEKVRGDLLLRLKLFSYKYNAKRGVATRSS